MYKNFDNLRAQLVKPIPPCPIHCAKREIGCRSTCPEWQEYERQYKDFDNAKMNLLKIKNDLTDYSIKSNQRIKKLCE